MDYFYNHHGQDVLLFPVRNPNRLVTKEELLQAVSGDTFVEEGNLTQYIFHLRKALVDNSERVRFIVTIARKGYQFTAGVLLLVVPLSYLTFVFAGIGLPTLSSGNLNRGLFCNVPSFRNRDIEGICSSTCSSQGWIGPIFGK